MMTVAEDVWIVLWERFVVSVHQQRGVDGPILGDGWLPNSCNDYAAAIAPGALGERIKNFGSDVLWDHGCGAREGEGPAVVYIGVDFLWMPPSLEAGQFLMPISLYG